MRKAVTKASALLMVLVLWIMMISGCGSGQTDSGTEGTVAGGKQTETAQSASETQAATVRDFSDIQWPEEMPAHPTLAESDYYDYDDMSKHYDLSILTYHYGMEPPSNSEDPILKWLEEKYNVTITFTAVPQGDLETITSTSFSGGDVADIIMLASKDLGFVLGEQGLLTDARQMYPYMPQTTKFVTGTILDWSTMEDGTIPFVTKYAVQDGDVWNAAIRQDWLDSLGMSMPKTIDDLKAYAKAVTHDDPDGNGKDDTWFMTGGGSGSFGMTNAFDSWFGNTVDHAEEGVLVSQYLNGNRKKCIEFWKELYEAGCLAPDWFTIDWESAKAYTMKDKVGMVNYPSSNLYQEYVDANNKDYSLSLNWEYLDTLPAGAKGPAGGNAGSCIAVPVANVKDDPGKLMRICHILDAMCYGGEAYFATVQGGGNEVHEGYTADVREYLEDGTNYCYVDSTHPGFTQYGTDNLALAPWQAFGYTLKWQVQYCPEDADDDYKLYVEQINKGIRKAAAYERWPNDSLLLSVPAGTAPNLKDYVIAQEYKFIVGDRSMDEWDDFVQEYLEQGGMELLEAEAKSLGCELPAELTQ